MDGVRSLSSDECNKLLGTRIAASTPLPRTITKIEELGPAEVKVECQRIDPVRTGIGRYL